MKRALYVTTRSFKNFGGVERYINNFAAFYDNKKWGHELIFLFPNGAKNNFKTKNMVQCEYYNISFTKFKNFFRFLNPILKSFALKKEIKKSVDRIAPDLIITRDCDAAFAVLLSGIGAPLYFMPGSLLKMDMELDLEYAGGIFYKISRKFETLIKVILESYVFKKCTKIVVFSRAFKNRVILNYGIKYSKIDVIPIGIGAKNIEKKSEIEKGTILTVSRLTKSKNIMIALDVMKRLDGFKMFIAGDGPERMSIMRKIDGYGLGKRVFLLGQIDSVDEYYRKCEIFIHLSYYENLGQVLLEAMSFGKPPIALHPGLSGVYTASDEIIREGYNGFLVKNDPDVIANKIKEVSGMDKNKFFNNCIQSASQYSFENHLEHLFKLIGA